MSAKACCWCICISLLLTACGSARWTKPNATAADLQRDTLECEDEAEKNSPSSPSNPFTHKTRTRFVARCMQTKGWTEMR